MVFSSLPFLSYFLPAVLLAVILFKSKIGLQNAVLTLSSLLFYAYGDAGRVLLLLICAYVSFACAKRGWTAAAILFNMGLLGVYKYAGFFIESVNGAFHWALPVPGWSLPIGISFFTFQAVSYVCDVRMKKAEAADHFSDVLLYLSLFPQLVAGPIVRWEDLKNQLRERRISGDNLAQGFCRLVLGLSKKVLLADTLARGADMAFATAGEALFAPMAWLGALMYCFQIFLDFSGYTDMALGLGKMLGFTFPENFRRPLAADSVRAFWRRWHMSLTDWFTRYVYIPLGGSHAGRGRTYLNVMLVFLLTGLWHGANWTFIAWGLYNGLLVAAERVALIKPQSLPKALRHGYVFLAAVLGFVIFRADSLAHAGGYLSALVRPGALSTALPLLAPRYVLALLAAIPASFLPAPKLPAGLRYALAAVMLALCMMALEASGYHPFIYFRF